MLKKLIDSSLHQPLFLFLLLILFVGSGIVAFKNLPIEAFPDVTDVQVPIITLFPGHAPEEVEKQVTVPIELALAGVPHAIRVFSHTQFGLSFIYVTFDEQIDHYLARQLILERVQAADLPEGVQPELGPLTSPVGEIYRIQLKSDTMSPMELRSLQDWVVSRQLKMVPGVADVVNRGGFVKQYQVVPDATRMRSLGISFKQLFGSLRDGNANAGGGFIERGEQQYTIRGIGLLRSREDIGNVVVAAKKGTPVLVKDVATVETGAVPRQGVVSRDDQDDIVTGIVLMRKGENPSVVLEGVKQQIEALNQSVLPKGVTVEPYYDRAWLISRTLKTVFTNLLEGALLVAVVLYIFLGNLRSAVVVAVIIPLALLATFIGLSIKGIPANLLSLGAMDFGIIVDGAVIVVENIFRRLSHHKPTGAASFKAAIAEATLQVGRPTFFSMLIIILAHLPIFALQRHEGRIFAPMAYTVVSALIGSLIFSLTLVPVLSYFLFRNQAPEHETPIVRFMTRIYQPALRLALRRRKTVVAVALAGLLASFGALPFLGTEFLPELNEGTIWVNFTLAPGISMGEVENTIRKVKTALRKFPEVKSVIAQAGRPEDGTDPKPINMVEVFVDVEPPETWKRGLSKEQVIAEMETALDQIPGVKPTFTQPIRDQVLESISQIDGQIVIKLFGEDGLVLRDKVNQVLHEISDVRGVARAFVDRAGVVPQLNIDIDRPKAARYGLNVNDIDDVIETALGGRLATELWEGERRYPVVVRLPERERRDSGFLRTLLLDTSDGSHVPLEQVAAIQEQEGALNISREAGRKVASIGVFIRGRDMGSIVSEMRQRVAEKIELPKGYYLEWGGEFENQQRAMQRLAFILPISIILIFVLLFEAFDSVKGAVLILSNVPLAFIGGVFALLAMGIHLSVSAAIGFIALFGQAVLNGVVMVSYFNELRAKGLPTDTAVFQGAVERLRTVMMTSLLAMLGLLPMALSKGIGSEVQRPLAVVIIGGLISATFLTLIVLPVLYTMFERDPPPIEPTPEQTPA
jgi:cobalt-zinc-cadmium resistance protein CzcA